MNSPKIINLARNNSGIKGWCLNKTSIGKRIVNKALESQYGKLEAVLPNGVRKFIAFKDELTKPTETVTYIEPKKLKPYKTTVIRYDEEWNRTYQMSIGTDPTNKHRRTCIYMRDYPGCGRRDYIYSVMHYDLNTLSWVTENIEKRIFIRSASDEFKAKTINKNLKDKITETNERTFTFNPA